MTSIDAGTADRAGERSIRAGAQLAVSLRNIAKSYVRGKERLEVLRGLDLEISAGEFLALMGPSGLGKTTILNLIAGLDRPNAGEVTIAGERIDRLGDAKLASWRAHHVGFVFQFYNLLPMLSAAKNVELLLLLTHLSGSQRRERARVALDIVGLQQRGSHRPGELSGGEQQRVAIARAIVTDPTIVVCDEPTGDLDRATAVEILGLLKALNQTQGKTIIMVTHDPKAANWASRELHVDKGKLVADGATATP
jgi:putative ABC transport system ATP-binding protein